MRWISPTLIAAALAAACGSPRAVQSGAISGGTSDGGVGNFQRVFVILMENQSAAAIYQGTTDPYLTGTLMKQYGYATAYQSVVHPSEPNYVWLEAGSNDCGDVTFTTDNDPSGGNSTATTEHLSTLLDHAGKSWREYAEDMPPGACPLGDSGEFAVRHVPYVFFQDVAGDPPSATSAPCLAHVYPFGQLAQDLASGTLPDYAFITPNVIDDMHDGTVADGDGWLSGNSTVQQVVSYVTDPANRALLLILWDECDSCGNAVGAGSAQPAFVVTAPSFLTGSHANATVLSHSSVVRSMQEIFGLTPAQKDATTGKPYGWLRHAGDSGTNDLSSFFAAGDFP